MFKKMVSVMLAARVRRTAAAKRKVKKAATRAAAVKQADPFPCGPGPR